MNTNNVKKQITAARTIQRTARSMLQRKKTALNKERTKLWGQKHYFDIQLEIISEMYNYDYNLIVHVGTNNNTNRLYQFLNELKKTKKPIVILFIYPIEYLKGSTSHWKQNHFGYIYSEFNRGNNIHITTIYSKLGNLDDKTTKLDIIQHLLKSKYTINNIEETNSQFSIPPRNMKTTIRKNRLHNTKQNQLNLNETKLIKNINIISHKILKNNNKVFFVNEAIFDISPGIKVNTCFSQVPFLLSIILNLYKRYGNAVKLYERNSTLQPNSMYKDYLTILNDQMIKYAYGTNLNRYVHNVNNTTKLLHINFRH